MNKKPQRVRSKRSNARLAAVQALYSWEQGGQADPAVVFDNFLTFHKGEQQQYKLDLEYFKELFFKTIANVETYDKHIASITDRQIERLDPTERAILRYSSHEMLGNLDLDAAIIINEAVEITKEIGSSGATTLVNKYLDELNKTVRWKVKSEHLAATKKL